MSRKKEISDADVLAIARECFLHDGPSTSTQSIADRAGVSQATLFKRFGTKAQLIRQALRPPGFQEWFDTLEAGPDARPVPEQLHGLGRLLLAHYHRMIPQMAVLRAAGLDHIELIREESPPLPLRALDALEAWFHVAIGQGRLHSDNPNSLATAFIGSLQVRAFWRHILDLPLHQEADEDYLSDLIDTLWRGIRPLDSKEVLP